jgi:hypothetical protein
MSFVPPDIDFQEIGKRRPTEWMQLAEKLFSQGTVAVLHRENIIGVCTGYVEDPAYGKLIQVEFAEGARDHIDADPETEKGVGGAGETGNRARGNGA